MCFVPKRIVPVVVRVAMVFSRGSRVRVLWAACAATTPTERGVKRDSVVELQLLEHFVRED